MLGKRVRRPACVAGCEVVADRTVVRSGVRKRLLRETEARAFRQSCCAAAQFFKKHRIVAGIDDDTDVRIVLRGRPHERWSADVDVLDRFVELAPRARDRCAKWIKVDHDELDGGYAVCRQRRYVFGDVAPGEDAAVDLGM